LTEDRREYVPVGKQMLWHDGILYVVSPNGKQIFRSVTGRPLDFMVNITPSGDKDPLEAVGGASSVSHSVDFEPITSINRLSFFIHMQFVTLLTESRRELPSLFSSDSNK